VSFFRFGINLSLVSMTAAICIAVGNTSFDDYDLFTSSLGCTDFDPSSPPIISIALFEITSFPFILD